MDAHDGLALLGWDHPVLDGERSDAREHVAAVGRHVHGCLVDDDLREEVVNVAVDARWRADNRHLARERVRAADAVDLTHVGRAHRREQDAVPQGRVGGQVRGQEVRPFGGAAPHQNAWDLGLHR